MLTQDYLVRLLVDFAAGIMRSMQRATNQRDPKGAAEMLEMAVGESVDMDGATLLSLSPDSIATIMQVSGVDPSVTEYIARSLLLAASYYEDAGESASAGLRASQAKAIASAYGHNIDDMLEAEGKAVGEMEKAMESFLSDDGR